MSGQKQAEQLYARCASYYSQGLSNSKHWKGFKKPKVTGNEHEDCHGTVLRQGAHGRPVLRNPPVQKLINCSGANRSIEIQ